MMSNETVTTPYAERAKNILKGELKRRGLTYADLADRLTAIGASESERNIANKISRGSFTAAFFMMCMEVIGVNTVSLET